MGINRVYGTSGRRSWGGLGGLRDSGSLMLWTSDAVFECCWNGKHADHELAAVLKDSCFHAHAHPENKGSRLEPYWLYPIIMSAPDPQNVFQVAGHLAFESGWFSGGLMLYRLAPRTQLSSLLRFLIESKQMSLVVELISDALGIVCPLRSASTSSSSSSSPNAIHGLADQSSSPSLHLAGLGPYGHSSSTHRQK